MQEIKTVIQRLRRDLFLRGSAESTDGQLLESFLRQRDQAAFEALMQLHGTMVFGVCRRVLGNHHDAEDAFQATFLVLARSAPSISKRCSLASWLFGVARRTALNAKKGRDRRRTREKAAARPAHGAQEDRTWSDLEPILDRELSRLPSSYREAVVLCDLEGKTYQEAARLVGSTERAISMRLSRGRSLLAQRLTRSGKLVSAGSLVLLLSQNSASAAPPAPLVVSTAKAFALPAVGQAAAAGLISPAAVDLSEGVLRSMFLSKLKIGAALAAIITLLGFGLGSLLVQMQAAEPPLAQTKPAGKTSAAKPAAPPAAAPGKQPDPLAAKRQELLDVAKRVYETGVAQFRIGIGNTNVDDLYQASCRWRDAARAVAADPQSRVAASETHLQRMKEQFDLASRLYQEVGEGSQHQLESCRYFLLEAEIQVSEAQRN